MKRIQKEQIFGIHAIRAIFHRQMNPIVTFPSYVQANQLSSAFSRQLLTLRVLEKKQTSPALLGLLKDAKTCGVPISFMRQWEEGGFPAHLSRNEAQGVVLDCTPKVVPVLSAPLGKNARRPLWLLLESIEDPFNLGSIVRTALFF